jgi:hypothetical protein
MTSATSIAAAKIANEFRLWPRIAVLLVVKIAFIAVLWFLFVRDQRVSVDAHGTAAAFGLLNVQPGSK